MRRPSISIVTAGLLTAALCPADAATERVQVPGQYNGAWVITALTKSGPCAASTSYQVQIKDGDASVPEGDIGIDGRVSADGAVQGTITKGANKAPITGSLDAAGNGSGTWHASDGVFSCSGSWTAKRAG